MIFSLFPSSEKRPEADLCVLPFAQGKTPDPLFSDSHFLRVVRPVLDTNDFSAQQGEVLFFYPDAVVESRVVLLGVGEKESVTLDSLRVSFAALVAALKGKKIASMSVLTPFFEHLSVDSIFRGVLEGVFLGSYTFQEYRSEQKLCPLKEVSFLCETPSHFVEIEQQVRVRMDALFLTRDLINKNADEVTPDRFADLAASLACEGLQVQVYEKEWIEKERMDLLLAVSRASSSDPRFIVMKWNGAPQHADLTALVGKGITFDSGGLHLKSAAGMLDQKTDMAGAAAVLGTVYAISRLELPVNLVAVIPVCENSIGSYAYKPGDVYRSRANKTIEIGSTDAEGRLILADALSYVIDIFSPSRVIDVATLTGAAEVALGKDISALFSNTDSLACELEQAAHHVGESMCRMPLHLPYKKLLESEFADYKNVAGRIGGAINAALFLHLFVGEVPWAHIDIAGPAFLEKPSRYFGKGATGVAVQTLIEFFVRFSIHHKK